MKVSGFQFRYRLPDDDPRPGAQDFIPCHGAAEASSLEELLEKLPGDAYDLWVQPGVMHTKVEEIRDNPTVGVQRGLLTVQFPFFRKGVECDKRWICGVNYDPTRGESGFSEVVIIEERPGGPWKMDEKPRQSPMERVWKDFCRDPENHATADEFMAALNKVLEQRAYSVKQAVGIKE